MPTLEILKTYTAVELKREIGKTRIKKYSHLKKNDLINLMLKPEHINKFHHMKGSSISLKRAIKQLKTFLKTHGNKLDPDIRSQMEGRLKSPKTSNPDAKAKTMLKLISDIKKKYNIK